MDYYKILGLYRDAKVADIRREYWKTIQEIRLEMECRKTRQVEAAKGIQSEEIMQKLRRVHEAFSILDNPTSRNQYNAHLEKLDQNQYEKFGPSWHRWYFKNRERSIRMRGERTKKREEDERIVKVKQAKMKMIVNKDEVKEKTVNGKMVEMENQRKSGFSDVNSKLENRNNHQIFTLPIFFKILKFLFLWYVFIVKFLHFPAVNK